MVTGNRVLPSSLFKKEFHLTADNEQEDTGTNDVTSFIDISRFGIQVLKLNTAFKAIEFVSFLFPYSGTDSVWSSRIENLHSTSEFNNLLADTKRRYSVRTAQVTFIPKALYNADKKAEIFNSLFNSVKGNSIDFQNLANSEMVGLFSVPEILKTLTTGAVTNSFCSWMDTLEMAAKFARATLVIEEREFALVIIKDGQLKFCNWFSYSKNDDVLYFLMATLENLKILHSEIEISLGGMITKGDDLHFSISKYLGNISFLKKPTNLTYSYSFNQLADHKFPFILATACA